MSGGATNFTIVITALDRATATFHRVNTSVAGMVSPFKNVGRAVAEIGEAAGLAKLSAAADNAITKFGVLGSHISGLLGPLAAVGGLASAGGLFELAKSAGDWGESMKLASQKTGVAVDALAKLHYLAERNNIDTGAMDKALYRLNLTIGQAATGQNKKAAAMFRALGIPVRDNRRHLRDAAAVWSDLSEAMRINTGAVIRTQIVATAFGSRFGEDLIPVLLLGRKETTALYGVFEKMYGKITPQLIASLDAAHDKWEELHGAMGGLKLTLGAAVIPAMESVIIPLTRWIAANRVLISQRVGEWATRAGAYIRSIDWKSVGAAALGFARAIGTVGRILGPVGTTVAVLTLVFSPFIAATLSAAGALAKLAIAMAAVIVRLGLMAFGGLIESLVAVIPMIRSFRDLWVALDLVMDANPIALTALAILAIGASGYYAYTHFKPFHDLVNNKAWPIVVKSMASAIDALASAIDHFSAAAKFGERYLGLLFGGRAVLSHIPADIGRVTIGKSPMKVSPRRDDTNVWDWRHWFDFSGPSKRPPVVAKAPAMKHPAPDLAGARAFFHKAGWSEIAASALAGNLAWESGLNPAQRGDHGAAYGVAQWHRARAAEFARIMHKPLVGSTLADQLRFVNYELTKGDYRRVGALLRKAWTLTEATGIINRLYERPAAPSASQPQRTALANQIFNMNAPAVARQSPPVFKMPDIAAARRISGAPSASPRPPPLAAIKMPTIDGALLDSDRRLRDRVLNAVLNDDRLWSKKPGGSLASNPVSAPPVIGGGGGHSHGRVDVKVDFHNVPRGAKVAAKTSGPQPPSLDTGVAFAF